MICNESIIINKSVCSSNFEVLDSGSVISYDGSSDIVMSYELKDFLFCLKMTFGDDADNKDPHYKVEPGDDDTVHFRLYNFNNILGSGNTDAIRLAIYEGKGIFFRFWVTRLGERGTLRVDYTLYKEK